MADCFVGAVMATRSPSFHRYTGLGELQVEASLLNTAGHDASELLRATPMQNACLIDAARTAVEENRRKVDGLPPRLVRGDHQVSVSMQTVAGDVVSHTTVTLDTAAVGRSLLVVQVTAIDTRAPGEFRERLLASATKRI